MNIAALIFALLGSGLSLFQPVIPVIGLSFADFLSIPDSDLNSTAVKVFFVAVIAVVCGICAMLRKGKNYCVIGLSICAALYILSFFTMKSPAVDVKNLPFDPAKLASSLWMKTAFVWACCYIAAAVCAFFDKTPEPYASSAPVNATPSASNIPPAFTSSTIPSPSEAQKTFEPVLGVETPALIKRGKIFLSDDDFAEAERYFEQALRQDPENSQAYLGKLMAELRVHNADELSNIPSPLSEQKLFRRALEFANDEERATIQKYLADNTEHLEQIRLEQERKRELDALEEKYREAVNAKHSGEENRSTFALEHAAKLFEQLGDYKDSRTLAEESRLSAQNATTEKKYNDAVYNKNYGEANHNIEYLKRAAEMFDELGGYKNSKILAYNTRKQIAIELERAKEQAAEQAAAVKGIIFVLGFVLLAVIILISINR